VLDRVLAFGDAWFPNFSPDLYDRIAELRARADRPIEVQVMAVPPDPKVFERLREAGVRRVAQWLPSGPRSRIERALDGWESAIADYNPE
jgi:hypothetical protein